MATHQKPVNRWLQTANALGAFGYLSLIIQWLWTIALFLYPMLTDEQSILYTPPVSAPATPDVSYADNPLAVAIGLTIAAIVMAATIITIIKLPRNASRTAAKATANVSRIIVPLVTDPKKLSKRRRLKLTSQIVILLKICLMALPVAATSLAPTTADLSISVAMTVSVFCGLCSAGYFGLQYLLAAVGRLDHKNLW